MDPFTKLPAEIRESILIQLDTRQQVSFVGHASAVMLHQSMSRASKSKILRKVLLNDLPGGQLADAIAVLTIRRNAELDTHVPLQNRLSNRWQSLSLNDVYAVNLIRRRMIAYINDYLLKATALNLRRAYSYLPLWAHNCYAKSPTSQSGHEKSEVGDIVCFFGLSKTEQHRLLGAFLRYEHLCRLHQPKPLPHLTEDEIQAEIDRLLFQEDIRWTSGNGRFKQPGQEAWDWRALEGHGSQQSDASVDGEPGDRPWEMDMLQCVHEYFVTLYGALLAQNAEPNIEFQFPVQYPGELCFDGSSYIRQRQPDFLNLLAGYGLDLVDHLMRQNKATLLSFVKRFHAEERYRPSHTKPVPTIESVAMQDDSSLVFDDDLETVQTPGSWLILLKKAKFQPGGLKAQVMWAVYRQRAWAFFDDLRFYSKKCIFPTLRTWYEMDSLYPDAERHYNRSVKARSKFMHEILNPDVSHDGAVETEEQPLGRTDFLSGRLHRYPSLDGRLVSFWEVS